MYGGFRSAAILAATRPICTSCSLYVQCPPHSLRIHTHTHTNTHTHTLLLLVPRRPVARVRQGSSIAGRVVPWTGLNWCTYCRCLRKHLKCHFLQIELNNWLLHRLQQSIKVSLIAVRTE
jgi:hypothetical protein